MRTNGKKRSAIERLRDWHAETAIVLGSGLNALVVDPADERVIPHIECPELPQTSVPGHAGRFVL
jgi:purine nucleoside phosphorylase